MSDREEDTNEELSEHERERRRRVAEIRGYLLLKEDSEFNHGLSAVLTRSIDSGAMWFDEAAKIAEVADRSHYAALVELVVYLTFER